MYMSFATHIHVTRIAAMRIIFTRIGCTLLTCDMYIIIISLPSTPSCNKRHHTYGYVTCSKVNIASSSGTSSDVTITVRLTRSQGHTEYTPEERHIHVKKIWPFREPKCSLQSSQQPVAGPNSEPDESCLHSPRSIFMSVRLHIQLLSGLILSGDYCFI
jgi:hypothetical protein